MLYYLYLNLWVIDAIQGTDFQLTGYVWQIDHWFPKKTLLNLNLKMGWYELQFLIASI